MPGIDKAHGSGPICGLAWCACPAALPKAQGRAWSPAVQTALQTGAGQAAGTYCCSGSTAGSKSPAVSIIKGTTAAAATACIPSSLGDFFTSGTLSRQVYHETFWCAAHIDPVPSEACTCEHGVSKVPANHNSLTLGAQTCRVWLASRPPLLRHGRSRHPGRHLRRRRQRPPPSPAPPHSSVVQHW